jgi:hypothetical protein
LEIVGAIVTNAIDEKCGRSIYAPTHTAYEIFPNPGQVNMAIQFVFEFSNLQSQPPGMSEELRMRKFVLMFIEAVMHLPKLSLGTRCFRCLSRLLSVGMNRRKWKIAKNEPHLVAQRLLKLLDDGIRFAAVRALVVAKLK